MFFPIAFTAHSESPHNSIHPSTLFCFASLLSSSHENKHPGHTFIPEIKFHRPTSSRSFFLSPKASRIRDAAILDLSSEISMLNPANQTYRYNSVTFFTSTRLFLFSFFTFQATRSRTERKCGKQN